MNDPGTMLFTLLLASCLGCIPGAIAQRKGYDFLYWWGFGTALFVVALPVSLMLKPRQTTSHPNQTPAA